MFKKIMLLLGFSILFTGCSSVSEEDYNDLLAEKEQISSELTVYEEKIEELEAKLEEKEEELKTVKAEKEKYRKELKPYLEQEEKEKEIEESIEEYRTDLSLNEIVNDFIKHKNDKVKFSGYVGNSHVGQGFKLFIIESEDKNPDQTFILKIRNIDKIEIPNVGDYVTVYGQVVDLDEVNYMQSHIRPVIQADKLER